MIRGAQAPDICRLPTAAQHLPLPAQCRELLFALGVEHRRRVHQRVGHGLRRQVWTFIIPKLFADFAAQGESEMWNIQISDQVTAPVIRQTIKRGHGNM